MLKLFDIPNGEPKSEDYKVFVNGIKADVNIARVSAMPFNRVWPGFQRPMDQTELASFVSLESDEECEFEIIPEYDFTGSIIRPISKNIKINLTEETIKFKLPSPGQYVLECGGPKKALHIFINPIIEAHVCPKDKVIYFAPGIHDAGRIELNSGETLYIDSGAIVYGSVIIKNACNVNILGGGILDNSLEVRSGARHSVAALHSDGYYGLPYDLQNADNVSNAERNDDITVVGCMKINKSENISVNDIIFRDSSVWTATIFNSKNVIFNNVKAIGMWRYNSDGIDFVNSSNGIVKNSFLRNFDDVIVLKGLKGHDTENICNILVENNVIWCDWGRGMEIGAETCADEYFNITFRNCDIIHGAHIHMDIQNGDRAKVHDVLFENIRVEYSRYEQMPIYQDTDDMKYLPDEEYHMPWLFYAETYTGMWSRDFINGDNNNIKFKNITVFTEENMNLPKAKFTGSNEESRSHDFTIENLVVNGKKLSADDFIIELNEYTENIDFI